MKTLISALTIVLFSMLIASCNFERDQLDTSKVLIDSTWEDNPPIPEAVFIQQLEEPTEKGNLLFTARFEDNRIKSQFIALTVDDDKVILRDDGKGGDEEADDKTFSIILKENLDELASFAGSRIQTFDVQEPILKFNNRTGVMLDREELRKTFGITEFDRDLRKRKPIELFFTQPSSAELIKIKDHSLLINHQSVVEDPTRTFNPCTGVGVADGAWTFGNLMKELANETITGVDPITFTKKWLESWKTNAVVNNDQLVARNQIDVILRDWERRSGGPSQPLKLEQLPFKLIAIVNRLDLRGNSGYGFSNAGEGRFVFVALDDRCRAMQFTVIFEYGINKKRCGEVKAFAQQWFDLQNDPIGSAAYNQKLQQITDQFTRAGSNTAKPNQSSLNQLRTNEIRLGNPWELREFVISPTSKELELATVKQEPASVYNNLNGVTPPQPIDPSNIVRLVKFINDNEAAIVNNTYTVPEVFDGAPFLGGKSHTLDPVSFHWGGGTSTPQLIGNPQARHIFSLNTCSGCHGGEAKTLTFTHIRPTGFGGAASLSGFLTGLGPDDKNDPTDDDNNPLGLFYVNDPAGNAAGSPRGFNDLARRASDLHALVNSDCRLRAVGLARQLTFKPVRMEH